MLSAELRMLSYGEIRLKDPFLIRSMELEKEYLLSLDADRLLAGFRETAGKKTKAMLYPGWESTEIRGHTMGHYLTALSQLWAYEHDPEILDRIGEIIEGLADCQREDGYLCAFPEVLFDRVEQKEPAWVPWYTMHKIISGVTAVYRLCGLQKAYKIMKGLADWAAARILSWSDEVRETVLAVEYGGMNDCLYDVYKITGDPIYAKAAAGFDEMPLFKAIAEGKDVLDGLHANTTIPKILGGLKRYDVLKEKEPFYLEVAERFWDMVVHHHTYITGGNSEWEHFGQPDILDGERSACNCETCNTYNMLKLTSLLFRLTGKKKYADYDERTYINAILSSQNHETGMTTYFQPMASGYFKVYSRPYDNFWCCTGTGMENFTKQCEGICYAGEDILYINRYVSSDIEWKEKGLRIELEAGLLTEQPLSIRVYGNSEKIGGWKIAVRVPEWTAEEPRISCSSEVHRIYEEEAGDYFLFEGQSADGGEISIDFPMQIQVHGLPDASNVVAFTYGPFVLSADMGIEDMVTATTGVDVTVPVWKPGVRECILYDGPGTIGTDPDLSSAVSVVVTEMMKKTGEGPEFILRDAAGNEFIFSPHFLKNQVRYGIYFYLYKKGSEEYEDYRREQMRKEYVMKHRREVIPLGNDQYELAHGIQGSCTEAVNVSGKRGRSAKPGGWFSYEMDIPQEKSSLAVTWGESGSCRISVDGELLSEKEDVCGDTGLCEKEIPLPAKYAGKRVRIEFRNTDQKRDLQILNELCISVND